MKKLTRNSLPILMMLVIVACNIGGGTPASLLPNESSVLRLEVRTQNNVTTFNRADEVINFEYVIGNTGAAKLAEPVLVSDNPRQVICPALSGVGNKDIYLDQNESVTCTSSYRTTAADVTAGTIVTQAVASAGGVASNTGRFTLTLGSVPPPSSILRLTKTASSQTYGAPDQLITYTFTITNNGTTPLGPAQFTVSDGKLGAPFNCGPANTTLNAAQSVSCSMDYRTTSGDMALANITNSATASGGGQTSPAATVVVTNLLPITLTPPSPTAAPASNLVPGSTVQHRVAVGEWLIQIARCYGANFNAVKAANPQISDPNFIRPDVDIVTVPNIGSAGKIYKSDTVPCVTFVTVQSGDTWASLAQKYNADVAVLQRANPGGLVVGKQAKIPLNSAGGGTVSVTPGPTTGVTPGVTTAAPMRITFEQGPTASRIGIINPNERIQYIFTAAVGQTVSITLQAPANEVSLGVNDPNGVTLKTADSSYIWSTNINTAGDYTINIASLTGGSSKSYTLQVTLTNLATPTPTFTPTSTPTTPVP